MSCSTFWEKSRPGACLRGNFTGPIGIAQASGEAYRAGIPDLLMLVSFISLQLGILNLLPIPVLDGGVIFLLLLKV